MDNKLRIINYLGKNSGKSYTMLKLSRLLNIPYATFYRVVQKMRDLLIINTVGKAKTLSLNLNNPVVKAYLTISSDEERKEYGEPIIKNIANELNTKDVVVLFGSYAKKTHTARSDIDFMVINRRGNKSISFSKYEVLFRKKINPMFITEKEFAGMLKDKEENVGKQVLKNHVILNNPEKFWGCVLDAVR